MNIFIFNVVISGHYLFESEDLLGFPGEKIFQLNLATGVVSRIVLIF